MAALIDLASDTLTPVRELARQRLGRHISPATIWRWRLKGVRGAYLEMVWARGCWCTTDAAFAEFIREQTAAMSRAADEGSDRDEATERRLRSAGLL